METTASTEKNPNLEHLLSLRERIAKQEAAKEMAFGAAHAPRVVSMDRRRSPNGAKTQIREMRSRHQQILRMDIKGYPQVEIAEILGITPQMVSIVQNSDVYRAEKARIEIDLTERTVTEASAVKAKIIEMSGLAIDELEGILKDRLADPKLKADVAFDILDRSGHKAAQRLEVVSYKDKLQLAYSRRKQRQAEHRAHEDAVDAHFTPVEKGDASAEATSTSVAVVASGDS